MEVPARSFRGFRIVGRGVTQAAIDRARAVSESVVEKHGITAADIRPLKGADQDRQSISKAACPDGELIIGSVNAISALTPMGYNTDADSSASES
jgi:hypothetical protein